MRALAILLCALAGCTAPNPGLVAAAEEKYPDQRALWGRSVVRTCGPNSGVCHDNRQFPDLQTAAGLLATVNQRCNQIRDSAASIDNLCEPPGDLLRIDGFTTRIGAITASPPEAPAHLVITLHDRVPDGLPSSLAVVRDRGKGRQVALPLPRSSLLAIAPDRTSLSLALAPLSDPIAAPGPGSSGATMARFLAPPQLLPGDETQVELGDPNGDGIFGADLGGALVKPGQPQKSYLLLRVLAPLPVGPGQTLTNTRAAPSTEAQMPIANFQHWDIDDAVIALWCWIDRMRDDGSNADGPIDYRSCDLSRIARPLHQGGEATTFSSLWSGVLSPSCAGPCHHAGTSAATTLTLDGPAAAYDALLGIHHPGPSERSPMLPFITRGDPERSSLYLKLLGDPATSGARMPPGTDLPPRAIEDVRTWIQQGANRN
ncbi:MAG: hypothetical protein EXR72_06075 [Myxococcales bacterium]|nr:hypothetical protein [Myxococcales bacterium]